jgi:thioredoxin-disulfide reductase
MFNFNFEKTKETSVFDTIEVWDLLVVGGGPAGLNAALYAKRKGLNVGIVTKEIGGQLHNTSAVDNYLGFKFIEGESLSNEFLSHINHLDIPVLKDVEIEEINHLNPNFEVILTSGKNLYSKTILLATGGSPRKLEVPGEKEYSNKGVSYCTTCDAPFFKDRHIIVAGGGNSAAEAVIDLVPWAKKITVIHRSQWRADEILLEKHQNIDKLNVFLNTQILRVLGDEKMSGIEVLDKTSNRIYQIEADGLFIEIGTIPNSRLVSNLVDLNNLGEVIVDGSQKTSLPGLFAAGDVTDQPHKQIIIAAAEGAKAALSATKYINEL